jgi:serine/threonine protein kinase
MSDHPQGSQTWIDRIATLFDQAWHRGEHPRIEDYLEGVAEPRRCQLLEELLRVDLDNRRHAGDTPSHEEYVIRFPENEAMIRAAVTGGSDESVHPSSVDAATPPQPSIEGGGCYDADGPLASSGANGATRSYEPEASHADPDATLSYSVARQDGNVESLLTPQVLERLANRLVPGIVLQGRYVLERELGRGAMGIVFLGRDNRLDRPVAIKLILPSGIGGRARGDLTEVFVKEAFEKEAKLGANLVHPAIATVYDYGFHGEAPFTVFEYIPGPTLRELLRIRKRFPLEDVKTLIGPLAQALDFAHARFVIHRDLKPENIKATEQGVLKILDLGLAKEFLRPSDWSGFAGTPAYAAPEQAAGLPCDGRTDQYSMALIVYEMLTGRRPFTATSPHQLLELQRTELPLSPQHYIHDLPDSIAVAILRALEKEPQRRFPSCCHFADVLGCNLIRYSSKKSDILRRSNVWIRVHEMGQFFELAVTWLPHWQGHIARTPDALYVSYGGEVTSWSNEEVSLLPNSHSRKISLLCYEGASEKRMTIEFEGVEDAKCWHDDLVNLAYSSPNPTEVGNARQPMRQVIPLLGRSPSAQYQVLGAVEARAQKRGSAEAALILEGAVLGADFVSDVEAEALPGHQSTEWRLAGYAARAIDQGGRKEFAVRWLSSKIQSISWKFAATMVTLLVLNLSSLTGMSALLVLGVVPAGFVLVLRSLQWPQLLRPTAFALFVFNIYICIFLLLSWFFFFPIIFLLFVFINSLSLDLRSTDARFDEILPFSERQTSAMRRAVATILWLFCLALLASPPLVILISWLSHPLPQE